MSAYLSRRLLPGLSMTASLSNELLKTWRVDIERWKDLDWQILVTNPAAIQDTAWHNFPREENAPSVALSLTLNKLNDACKPTGGMALFLEGRRYFIFNLNSDYRYDFNQATGAIRLYATPFSRQTVATHLKAIVRNDFDADHLTHRMISYNDGQQFRGFRWLAGTNLMFWNWEYRVHLFGFDMMEGLESFNLPERTKRLLKKLSYSAEAAVYVDNGVFFGRVYDGNWTDIAFKNIRLPRDLYTSTGIGGRLIYPKLGYVVSGGVTLYQHKEGLDPDFTNLFYGTVSAAF